MISKESIEQCVAQHLTGSDLFLVEVTIGVDNAICVEIDGDKGVDIDDCARLSRAIEADFDRDEEDYSLEVGSSGLTSPFKTERQYRKYIGEPVEVLTSEGRKVRGILKSVADGTFTVKCREKVKNEGDKRPHFEDIEHSYTFDNVKYTKYDLQF